MSDNPYVKRYPSPDGAHAVVTVDSEVKMSHWIAEPTLVDANDKPLLAFGASWSADRITWMDAGRVEIAMRHYPGDRDAVVTIDIARQQATLADGRALGFTAFRTWLSSPEQPNNPLHGITLERIVTELVDYFGWDDLAGRTRMNCFTTDPSIKSCLKFLRKTPWARDKIESLYLFMLREQKRERAR